MFANTELKTHYQTSSTIKSKSLILAEWNMNFADNVLQLGNYRYRPNEPINIPLGQLGIYKTLPSTFDANESLTVITTPGFKGYYTNATDSDITINNGYGYNEENNIIPEKFTSKKDQLRLLYSLEDCIKPFRPRSGINKAFYFPNRYVQTMPNSDSDFATRPRYYLASRDDQFKYWMSYRVEDNVERGVSKVSTTGVYYIDDTAPFVVYKEQVPANRLVVKMQTHVGSTNAGTFTLDANSVVLDPFYGDLKKVRPLRWKIQYLNNYNTWIDAISFDENSLRTNGSPVVGVDGTVELAYGLVTPNEFLNSFILIDTVAASHVLPEKNINGYAYLVKASEDDQGLLYIWNDTTKSYTQIVPQYKWYLIENDSVNTTAVVKDLTSPDKFNTKVESNIYRNFCYIKGIRVVVETLSKPNEIFELIEMSPRLAVDLSDKTTDFSITKPLSDLGSTSLPVGQLLASTGNITIFDYDQAFNENNSLSIISKYLKRKIKFCFYESILDVNFFNYTVPIKFLYSEGMPQADRNGQTISIELRDLFFLFESMKAPEILIKEASLSYAVSIILDSIGFSNYSFYRVDKEQDQIIPYFFISPDKSVAEILNQLAVSTQSAMFFDEYNNFIVMSKNYLMPSAAQRATDFELIGSNTQEKVGIVNNKQIASKSLPNIISISSENKKIYNNGKITYSNRYIQRAYNSIRQPYTVENKDNAKEYGYKPSLLWEISGDESTKTINEVASKQSSYILSAMPLNSDLTGDVPKVVNGQIINNVIDVGENIYWSTRYQGYLYSQGEIIKYDAVQFNIPGALKSNGTTVGNIGNVWISSNQEYQNYFSQLTFNGKIYPTGLVRIYTKPYYETVNNETKLKEGAVFEHGRGQFGTQVVAHPAGINSYWTNNNNVRGCQMQSQWLFNLNANTTLPSVIQETSPAGVNNELAKSSIRNSIIKNFLGTSSLTETEINRLQSTSTGTVQASAFVMNGPSFKTTETPLNFLSYVYKPLTANVYKHFGTRMRVIGRLQSGDTQTALGNISYFQISNASNPEQKINIAGGSGGIAIGVDEKTNNGYYFEIIALTEGNIESYAGSNEQLHNVIFYKIQKDASSTDAIPIKLYGGLAKIIVDDGAFAAQQRVIGEDVSTVYDIAVEYKDIDKIRKFYLYINNQLIAVVDDEQPITMFNNVALFVRGSSKCIFENIYALDNNYSQNTIFNVAEPLSKVFGVNQLSVNNAFSKYSISGLIQSTYLSGISSQNTPKYNLYYDEFGTIMRECAYFNIRYDKAYPALFAQIAPTFNPVKGYTVSGFTASPYGAEFLIFNNTDTALSLDESSGNYLKIQGITFTQDTTNDYTVDNYFSKRGNLSEPELSGNKVLRSPLIEANKYNDIKLSRINYGNNEFSIDTPYIQSEGQAEQLMSWIIEKLMVPKKSIGVEIFSTPIIQLGDIVTIDYKDNNDIDVVASSTDRFVVYNIEYSRGSEGPSMTIYLSEV